MNFGKQISPEEIERNSLRNFRNAVMEWSIARNREETQRFYELALSYSEEYRKARRKQGKSDYGDKYNEFCKYVSFRLVHS